MWTVVYISSNGILAEQLKSVLVEEGLLVMLRPVGIPFLGEAGPVELLVPESEAEEAHEIINSKIPI
ncbi:MAG: glutamate decarboxylase [Firmicutes bacterium HGW-Firmicutes-12]|nr:MAG: glutamate decarboxylase [Firmicutes bacterium HGW-Firmicutes-12]